MAQMDMLWRSRLSEGAVIVGSILLAFTIDAWWERRGEVEVERTMIRAVVTEVESNRSALRRHLDLLGRGLDRIDRFMKSTPEELASIHVDSVRPFVVALPSAPSFNPLLEASQVLAQAPPISSAGAEVRSLVLSSTRLWDDAQEGHDLLSDLRAGVRAHLATYAVESSSEGRAGIPTMVARGGPQMLAELRRDRRLGALVLEKAHTQSNYRSELERWLVLLDSLSVVLPRDDEDSGSVR